MSWILYGIAAGFFFAIYNSLLKLSSTHLHALIGSIALSFGSALITLGLILLVKYSGQEILVTNKGVQLAFLAGVLSAFGSFLYFVMYQHKAPISLGLPVLSISTVIFSVVIGLIFFGEKLSLVRIVGLVLSAISIYLLSL